MQFITLLNAFGRVWVRARATASYLRICHTEWFRDIMLSIHFGDGKTKTFFSQKNKQTKKTSQNLIFHEDYYYYNSVIIFILIIMES